MLYRVFKWLFYLTVRGYFRSIHFKGRSNIPLSGPVIFVANHNSAFMDPILLAVQIDRPLYFLTRGESFQSKLVAQIFSWLHMIPIYRPEISPDEVYKNAGIFQLCFDHLRQGKAIMIFPEGVSETVRILRPIKTGTARIALGAEEQNDFTLGLQIIPIGINYSNPHHFYSDVFVSIGTPIKLEPYRSLLSSDPVRAVTELTAEIKSRLEKEVVLVQDQSVDQLVRDIERLYRSMLRAELKPDHKASQDFYLSRQIIKAVNFYRQERPGKALRFQQKIRRYFEVLDQMKISDAEFRGTAHRSGTPGKVLYFVVGFPLFIYGLLVNIIPYKMAEYLARKVPVRKDFIGSMKLTIGMFVFLIFYIAQILVFMSLVQGYWWILFALSLYPAGLFTVRYVNQWYRFKGHLIYLKLTTSRKEIIGRLHEMRGELLQELELSRQLFQQQRTSEKE